jgi:hypothetical protein
MTDAAAEAWARARTACDEARFAAAAAVAELTDAETELTRLGSAASDDARARVTQARAMVEVAASRRDELAAEADRARRTYEQCTSNG